MSIILIGLVVLAFVGFFFIVPILLNREKEAPTDTLDLDSFKNKKKKEPLMRDDSEDMMV